MVQTAERQTLRSAPPPPVNRSPGFPPPRSALSPACVPGPCRVTEACVGRGLVLFTRPGLLLYTLFFILLFSLKINLGSWAVNSRILFNNYTFLDYHIRLAVRVGRFAFLLLQTERQWICCVCCSHTPTRACALASSAVFVTLLLLPGGIKCETYSTPKTRVGVAVCFLLFIYCKNEIL